MVKASDSKSDGIFPRRFESCRLRITILGRDRNGAIKASLFYNAQHAYNNNNCSAIYVFLAQEYKTGRHKFEKIFTSIQHNMKKIVLRRNEIYFSG